MPGYSRHLRQRVKTGGGAHCANGPGTSKAAGRSPKPRAARCAAPTECHEAARPGGRALHGMESQGRAGEGTRPYGESGSVSFFFVGAGHWPARRGSSAIPEPTLIRLASLGAFPLEGGRLCRRGKSLSPLFRCARYLPLIRGVVPPLRVSDGQGRPLGLPPIHGNRAAQCAAPTVLHGYIRNTGRAGEGTRPYGESGSNFFFFVGAGHWPARRGSSAIPEPTLIRLASLGTFPLKGGRLCGRGKSLSPLFRCARHLPLIRGESSPPLRVSDG